MLENSRCLMTYLPQGGDEGTFSDCINALLGEVIKTDSDCLQITVKDVEFNAWV